MVPKTGSSGPSNWFYRVALKVDILGASQTKKLIHYLSTTMLTLLVGLLAISHVSAQSLVPAAASSQTMYYLMTTVQSGSKHCLSDTSKMSDTLRLSLFDKTDDLPRLVFAPTTDEGGMELDHSTVCTPFTITKYAIYDKDGLGLYVDPVTREIGLSYMASAVSLIS